MKKRLVVLGLVLFVCMIAVFGQGSNIYTRYYDVLPEGVTTVFVEEVGIPFRKIDVTTSFSAFNVRFFFNAYTSNPTQVTGPQNVYQYVNVIATNLDTSLVEEAVIEFRVPKVWLEQHNFGVVTLYSFVEGSWIALDTTAIGEDGTNRYYMARTNGFTYFVIGAKRGESSVVEQLEEVVVVQTEDVQAQTNEPEPESNAQNVVNTQEQEESVLNEEVTPSQQEGPPILLIIILGFVFLLLVFVGVFVYVFRKDLFQSKTVSKKGDVFLQNVKESERLTVGEVQVRNLHELADLVESLDVSMYTQERTHMVEWVGKAVKDRTLAERMGLCTSKEQMALLLREEVNRLDTLRHKPYFMKTYGLSAERYHQVSNLILQWKAQRLPYGQMRSYLQPYQLSQQAMDDLLYGLVEEVEDFSIHPEDEEAIESFLFDALAQRKSFEETRISLLDAGWPRAVVEKKVRERFKKNS